MIKKILLSFFFLLSILAQAQTGMQLYEDAKALYKDKQTKKALQKIDKAIAADGKKLEYLALRSRIGQFISPDVSFESIQDMVNLYPDSQITYQTRAVFYFNITRDFDRALADLNKALSMNPDDSSRLELLNLRGSCNGYKGNHEQSLADAEEAIKLKPTDYSLLNNKANALRHLGKNEEAMELFKQIVELDPKNPIAYINLGYQLQLEEKYEESISYLEKGTELDPKQPFMWNNLGYSQYKVGKYKDAVKNINKSLKLDPSNSYAYRNLALIAIAEKDMKNACAHINKALQLRFTEMYGPEVEAWKNKYCLR